MADPRILYIVAQEGFRDEEYFVPEEIFEENDIEIVVASIEKGTAKGKLGGEVEVNVAIRDADIGNYDALVIAGGPGALELKEHDEVIDIIKKTVEMDKILAAICIAPAILAEADVLKGKRATVWNSDSLQSRILEDHGATYSDMPVEVDGNIITANGPEAAKKFAERIVEALKE